MLPTFIVIGAAKAGSTSMAYLLGAHPEVFVSDPKEPSYFSRPLTFESSRDWYESLFTAGQSARVRGEASTSYTHPHRIELVVPRIRDLIPDCRFIYMVRHPVRRLESDWKMRTLEGRLSTPIGRSVETDISLVTFGLYWRHLCRYREVFSDEQILVVFLEDLARNPEREISRAYRHIGVDADFVPESVGRPRNTARDRAQAMAASQFARNVPGARSLARMLPDGVVSIAKSALARPRRVKPEVRWSQGELEATRELFREDSRELLSHCGKPPDFWDL